MLVHHLGALLLGIYGIILHCTTGAFGKNSLISKIVLTHLGLVNFGNVVHWLLKRLVIRTAAAEMAAAVCITSHFSNH